MNLLLYSGGLDSTVLLYLLLPLKPTCLSFKYNSRHNRRELEAATTICNELKLQHIVLYLPNWAGEKNALTGSVPLPEGHYTDPIMSSTIVPFRNGIMLSFAAGIAYADGGGTIYAAMHAGDHAIYPDCRPNFVKAMASTIAAGTDQKVNFETPFLFLSKKEIVKKGRMLSVPFDATWTCYAGNNTPCDKCSACVERNEALQ